MIPDLKVSHGAKTQLVLKIGSVKKYVAISKITMPVYATKIEYLLKPYVYTAYIATGINVKCINKLVYTKISLRVPVKIQLFRP